MLKRPLIFLTLILSVSVSVVTSQIRVDSVEAKSDPKRNRSNGIQMLRQIKNVLSSNYYDKNFRGIDINARFKSAEEKIKTLDTNGEIFRVIATELMGFNDSHTRFIPPGRANRVEYGFVMQMIGDHCFVTSVKKGSDAELKELRVGDRITKIGQYDVTRNTLWALNYLLYSLEPMPVVPITVINGEGEEKRLVVESKITLLKDALADERKKARSRKEELFKCSKLSDELIACKLTTFSVDKKVIDRMMGEASGYRKMILDLRGNRGGFVSINEYLTGHFFDQEIKIGEMITRKKTLVRKAKPVRNNRFGGELVVLIDSNSASASEVFARVIQIEKRGRVVGDVSAGAVMTSIRYPLQITRGSDVNLRITPFAVSITIGDLIMSDGTRLEAVGVLPDHPVGPTPYALMNKTDPILAYAAGLMNVELTPHDAGKLNFMIDHDEDEEPEEDEETA
jgi:C-terminal processing protease CtpA/Prc